MELISTNAAADGSGLVFTVELDDDEPLIPASAVEMVDPEFELGLWLAGLESFLSLNGQLFTGPETEKTLGGDYSRHFRLTYGALLQCCRLNISLRRLLTVGLIPESHGIAGRMLDDFGLVLRECLIVNEGLVRSGAMSGSEWRSWCAMLSGSLRVSPAFQRLTLVPDDRCTKFLPERLSSIMLTGPKDFELACEFRGLMPRFAKLLKTLDIIGRMLRNDEPLKPSLLIFAHIYELTRDLVAHMNNRLSRFEDEAAEMFGLLDGASYTVSMELRKVYEDELKNVIGVRPAPSVYARVEAANSLLTESLQQILASFARLVEPTVTVFELFSNFQQKQETSLILREELGKVLKGVRAAEKSPDRATIESVRKTLSDFLEQTIRYLFYKDTETFERFSEEILSGDEKTDLVPILHRFGAYLETLYGQVNMRAVLADRQDFGG